MPRGSLVPHSVFATCVLAGLCLVGYAKSPADSPCEITQEGQAIHIHSGIVQRSVVLDGANVSTGRLDVAGKNVLVAKCPDVIVRFRFADPDRQPSGMTPEQADQYKTAMDFDGGVKWVRPIVIRSDNWAEHFLAPAAKVAKVDEQTASLTLTAQAKDSSPLAGVRIELTYRIHKGHPAVRKDVGIRNGGKHWLAIDQLTIDPLHFAKSYLTRTDLTPSERGAMSSVRAFSNGDRTCGVIAVSEVPSALRSMGDDGAMGYADEYFEWVLGPDESFTSEPVFVYGFAGESHTTASAVSTPLDRAVEGPYQKYLAEVVGVVGAGRDLYAPTWCTWSNMAYNINDAILREQADLAARCGFKMMLIDDGWQSDRFGTVPDAKKFPDFAATVRYIRSHGLALGLWVSCFRTFGSPDLAKFPNGRSLPLVKRRDGFGMSFASKWRDYYASDIVRLRREYGAVFFKQDFTNIKFGDIAAGHESRTAKESLLRGLRGLFESQGIIRKSAPDVLAQLSHEIYWGTPGTPCDVALIEYAGTYHAPPNDYGGAGNNRQAFNPNWKFDPAVLHKQLLRTCYNSRRRTYDHRGLPAYVIAYYAAHAVNFRGSLTAAVQDRQVCSWLGGCPNLFAGDLTSLTDANIEHYHKRFAMLERLRKRYDIYHHYQFSGVPQPTDTDWHWWGKLNENGAGVVVVIRGSEGKDERRINIPWVAPDKRYHVRALLAEKELGEFTGLQLQDGAVTLKLPAMGQEIIEVAPVKP